MKTVLGSADGSMTTPALKSEDGVDNTHIGRGWYSGTVKPRANQVYQQWIVEFILRQKPLPPSKDGRHVPLSITSQDGPLVDERRGAHSPYTSNSIRSSRYTIWDFLPKQILFQATRVSNFYFICIGIPQTIPGFSTTGNFTTILPLLFFMILTVFKEGYDDWRRHRMDEVENNHLAKVMRRRQDVRTGGIWARVPSWEEIHLPWRKRSGKATAVETETEVDVDDEFAWTQVKWRDIKVGDLLKLKRDDAIPADVILLHGSGDDGTAFVETMALDGETNLKSKQSPGCTQSSSSTIHDLKNINAEFVFEDPNRDLFTFEGRVSRQGQSPAPLTLNQVLLRGSVLRNTTCAIGLVINTGEECKIRMNANHHPRAKKPRLEHYAGQVVLTLIVYVIVISVGLSGGYLLWANKTENKSWYISDATVPFKQIIIGFAIMFNNVIPLAMYVTLEIVKLGQMTLVASDVGMFDESRQTPMRCNTNTILENLGQVGFILTDKTGTLTENVMKFRSMSIAGLVWTHAASDDKNDKKPDFQHVREMPSEKAVDSKMGKLGKPSIEITELAPPDDDRLRRPGMSRQSSSQGRASQTDVTSDELVQYVRAHPDSAIAHKARHFFLAMALCHTCLPEMDAEGGTDFQASSPDELALVRAAKDLGFLVTQRNSQTITLSVTEEHGAKRQEVYTILDIIEFSSDRKRMSIILRCPDGGVWLICKGADSTILPRLKQAALVERKSREVRMSVEVEKEQLRRSLQLERRSGLGERPSMAIERIRKSLDVRRSMDLRGSTDTRPSIDSGRLFARADRSPARLGVPGSDRRGTTRDARSALMNSVGMNDDATVYANCFKHLDNFATEGLRTLMFAHRFLSPEEYTAWKKIYVDATTSLVNRQARVEEAGEMIEQSLELLGASAIEDRLQQGVPETVDKLRRANMRIWMLTGDKRETAINVAHAARICRPESTVFVLDVAKGSVQSQLRAALDRLLGNPLHTVAVIDGHTLSGVEASAELEKLFYTLIARLDSVICCRASPAQKASITLAIPANLPGSPLTLAIGDGSNDIAMIVSAHVGVGISGREGLQAARVADFSIAQFQFLQRLLLVHGHWNYVRTAKFILWTFWKEMFFYMPQALFQQYCGYTGASLYENWSLTALNTLFTSLCVLQPGVLEKDLEAETLLMIPELYAFGQTNRGLNLPKYTCWMICAVLEGCIVWFLACTMFGTYNKLGDNGLFATGDLSFSLAIVWTNTKLLVIETHAKTKVVLICWSVTVAGWWVWNGFLCGVYSDNLSPYDVKGGFSRTFGNDPNWWLTLILVVGILVAMEIGYKTAKRVLVREGWWPTLWRSEARAEGRRIEREIEMWQELEKEEGFAQRLKDAEGHLENVLPHGRSSTVGGAVEIDHDESFERNFGPVRERRAMDSGSGKGGEASGVRIRSSEIERIGI